MLERVKQQPADDDRYVKTSYGVAARRVDEAPPADDEDAALFGGPSLQPVTYTSAPAPSRCTPVVVLLHGPRAAAFRPPAGVTASFWGTWRLHFGEHHHCAWCPSILRAKEDVMRSWGKKRAK